jgi:hypothetical protein
VEDSRFGIAEIATVFSVFQPRIAARTLPNQGPEKTEQFILTVQVLWHSHTLVLVPGSISG